LSTAASGYKKKKKEKEPVNWLKIKWIRYAVVESARKKYFFPNFSIIYHTNHLHTLL
jgi:hypothetical protein